jgi:hypothetical protein
MTLEIHEFLTEFREELLKEIDGIMERYSVRASDITQRNKEVIEKLENEFFDLVGSPKWIATIRRELDSWQDNYISRVNQEKKQLTEEIIEQVRLQVNTYCNCKDEFDTYGLLAKLYHEAVSYLGKTESYRIYIPKGYDPEVFAKRIDVVNQEIISDIDCIGIRVESHDGHVKIENSLDSRIKQHMDELKIFISNQIWKDIPAEAWSTEEIIERLEESIV